LLILTFQNMAGVKEIAYWIPKFRMSYIELTYAALTLNSLHFI